MSRPAAVAVCLCLLAAHTHAAVAEPAADAGVEASRRHFEAGNALYDAHRYGDAAAEFEAGWRADARPVFLYNLGSCYRRLGQLERAKDFYVRYLAAVGADDKMRKQAALRIGEIDVDLAAARAAAPPPPLVAATATTRATPPPRGSFARKNWWILPVGGAVLAGVGVGLYFALRPTAPPPCAVAGCFTVP